MQVLEYTNNSVDDLLECVKKHEGYNPYINSLSSAREILCGFGPYTYVMHKGIDRLHFFVSFVQEDYTTVSEEFRIDEQRFEYQYLDAKLQTQRHMIEDPTWVEQAKKQDPYFLEYFSDLDELIFVAALKISKQEAQVVV